MINRNAAWEKALKQSQKRINRFIKSVNWDIKKQIKDGRFYTSQTTIWHFSEEEQKEIENYYKKLKYDCKWNNIGNFKIFQINWVGKKINNKEE